MRLKGLSACENCISFHSYCFSAGVDNICPLTASFQELVAQQASASICPASSKEMVHRERFGPSGLSSESPFLDNWSAKAKLLTVSPPPSYKSPSVNSILIQSYHNHKLLQSSTSNVDNLLRDWGRVLRMCTHVTNGNVSVAAEGIPTIPTPALVQVTIGAKPE